MVSSHLQAFTLLLRTRGEIWLLPRLPPGEEKCLRCCKVNPIPGECLLCLVGNNIHAILYCRATDISLKSSFVAIGLVPEDFRVSLGYFNTYLM